tara:strand:- start:1736 stop:2182 length:447 start_codon:yes stop_codon:yes gene_type:complete
MEVKDHPNYLIYPDGRVFNKKSNKYLKPYDNGHGYKIVRLRNRKSHSIHRLVAIHYIPNPDNKPQVDHKNRIRDDNHVENLRWVNSSENILNQNIQKRNNTGLKWITIQKSRNTFLYCFNRKDCKRASSINLSKMICYSFFYLLKYPP